MWSIILCPTFLYKIVDKCIVMYYNVNELEEKKTFVQKMS